MKTEISPIATKILGMQGRKISQSKTLGPPTAIWNAKIVDTKETVLWFGDIDIKRSREQLLRLADQHGPLHILRESDSTIDGALVMIGSGKIWIDDKFASYISMKSVRQTQRHISSEIASNKRKV